MASYHGKAYVGVHPDTSTGDLIYIILDDRNVFDSIQLPEGGDDKVRHKALETERQYIVFQHWIQNVTTTKEATDAVHISQAD